MHTTEVVNFLYTHLEQYGDEEKDINKAIAYAMNGDHSPGGFVLTSKIDNQIVGVVVVNKTGMKGYIPENILVFIATHNGFRGQGIGKQLMKMAIENCDGDVALHVEPDNPAKFLYEKLGFENKYLEMRFKKT
ncbi:MAG: ribosomal-protein-alanine N-acetyltransferase [Saprospiraceae bacterium]